MKTVYEKFLRFERGRSVVMARIVVDNVDELPEPDGIEDKILEAGSRAEVINSGSLYKLNSEGSWVKWQGDEVFSSAADLKQALASGAAADRTSYGDIITVSRTTSDGETRAYDWEIIGKDEDGEGTLTLQLYRVWGELMTMGEEKLATFPDGLPVGDYSLTLPQAKALLLDAEKTIYFWIGTAIGAGGYLTFDGNTLKSFNADGTVLSRYINWKEAPTDGATYTDLGRADGSTPHINKIERAVLGVNDYENSPLREWLNDDRPASERDADEWSPANEFSIRPPSRDGFLYGWEESFAQLLTATSRKVLRRTAVDGDTISGTVLELDDKVWLPAYEEIGYTYPATVTSPAGLTYVEGKKYGYFDQFDKIKLNENGAAVSCLLRTAAIKEDTVIVYGDDERTGSVLPGIAPCVVISGGAD